MAEMITLDPITKRFTQIIPEEKVCYICSGNNFVDDHHYDLKHGKISDETVPLCRRCHKTIHMFRGIHMFEDVLLDKAIEVWNKTLVLLNPSLMTKELMTRDKIVRSNYWLKKHGIKQKKNKNNGETPAFRFKLPYGEPLCGWPWVNEHMNDLKDYVPRIEIVSPSVHFSADVDSAKRMREVSMALRGLKVGENEIKEVITLDPVTKRFSKEVVNADSH